MPLSCCTLNNANETDSFLNPEPANLTFCQALNPAEHQYARHTVVCAIIRKLLLPFFSPLHANACETALSILIKDKCGYPIYHEDKCVLNMEYRHIADRSTIRKTRALLFYTIPIFIHYLLQSWKELFYFNKR